MAASGWLVVEKSRRKEQAASYSVLPCVACFFFRLFTVSLSIFRCTFSPACFGMAGCFLIAPAAAESLTIYPPTRAESSSALMSGVPAESREAKRP